MSLKYYIEQWHQSSLSLTVSIVWSFRFFAHSKFLDIFYYHSVDLQKLYLYRKSSDGVSVYRWRCLLWYMFRYISVVLSFFFVLLLTWLSCSILRIYFYAVRFSIYIIIFLIVVVIIIFLIVIVVIIIDYHYWLLSSLLLNK